ncbi:hypothetical protein [Gordonia sp. SL306]|uniref:hypothetical protein n=1 Tax=Gordonia sp. SL306 TaxID=2995145 RepID=UPI0022718483|nr:hypothetical protein [Gordonia sp. SL306]WAC56776.1 hypothetical protein OVA31_05860 [Gordonia sp. SL306]
MRSIDPFHALVLLGLLFTSGAWCLARPGRWSATVLVVVAGAWIVFNGPLEGRTLFVLSARHGVTEGDVLSVVGFAIAGWALWQTETRAGRRWARERRARRRSR